MLADGLMLAGRLSELLARFGQPRKITSGYRLRPVVVVVNGKANEASHSLHMLCRAGDVEDQDWALKKWVRANPHVLVEIGLWVEDFAFTPTWLHAQIVPPASGRRMFIPY